MICCFDLLLVGYVIICVVCVLRFIVSTLLWVLFYMFGLAGCSFVFCCLFELMFLVAC